MKKCYHCGQEWELREHPGFNAVCENCRNYLHSCVNCSIFDHRAGRCTSGTTEPVKNINGKNYCEEFYFRGKTDGTGEDKSAEARKKLEDLFGNSPEQASP